MGKFKALQSAFVIDSKESNVTKDVTKNVTKDVTKNVTKDVTIEEAIVSLIRENGTITTDEMAERLSVTRRTIQRNLDTLKDEGIVERKGGRRFGYWVIHD